MTRPLPSNYNPDDRASWPLTQREALDRLLAVMSPQEKLKIAAMPEHLAESLNIDLGAYIRKICGLWLGNSALMSSCAADNPEDTSLSIIHALRAELKPARPGEK